MIKLEYLNPCPTCGKKDDINSGQTSPGRYFVRCNRCMVSVNDDRTEKVQAEWNEIGLKLREENERLTKKVFELVKHKENLERDILSLQPSPIKIDHKC